MVENGNSSGGVWDQFAYFAHHEKSQETRPQTVDILKKHVSLLVLVHICGYKSILDDVQELQRLSLGHSIIKLLDQIVFEFDESGRSLEAFHDLVNTTLPMIHSEVPTELHEHIYGFIELFLTQGKAEKLESQRLLNGERQLKVEL